MPKISGGARARPRRSHCWRLCLAAGLAVAGFSLTGCEQPDFSTVKFKPVKVDPKAFKSAFKAYLFVRGQRPVAWGNEFLYHARSLAEREYLPLSNTTVLLDEATRLTTDDGGLVALDGMSEGHHSLRVKHDGVEYATHFRIKREQVTLVICEIRPGGVMASAASVIPHSFLTVQPFKRLLAFHQGTDKVLDIYQGVLQGKNSERWEKLLAEDYSDGQGGKEDFIRALRLRGQRDPSFRVHGRQCELGEKSAYVVAQLTREGNPDFVRLELKGAHDGTWRITSIQD